MQATQDPTTRRSWSGLGRLGGGGTESIFLKVQNTRWLMAHDNFQGTRYTMTDPKTPEISVLVHSPHGSCGTSDSSSGPLPQLGQRPVMSQPDVTAALGPQSHRTKAIKNVSELEVERWQLESRMADQAEAQREREQGQESHAGPKTQNRRHAVHLQHTVIRKMEMPSHIQTPNPPIEPCQTRLA